MVSFGNKEISFTSFYVMIKEARIARLWIYQVSRKKWFTPEEMHAYVEENKQKLSGDERDMADYRIIDPRKGLQDRIAVVKKVSDELVEFNQRLKAYYNK